MIPDASRRVSMRHVTSTGTALAATLLPLAVGVLLAKTMAGDPLAPVNALMTSGGHRARISPSDWRRCGRTALSKWRPGTKSDGADSRSRVRRRTYLPLDRGAPANAGLRRVAGPLRGVGRPRADDAACK
ncbi:hypothetical protein [Streptomyces chryseus]